MHVVTPLIPRANADFVEEVRAPRATVRNPSYDAMLHDALTREGCKQKYFKEHWALIEQGEGGSSMYLIVQGEVEVRLGSRDGQALATLRGGELVGEMSIVDGSPACAYVVATKPTTAIEVPRHAFWRMVEVSHVFARRLLSSLSQRLRANNETVISQESDNERLQQEAFCDPLTGALNRRWLDEQLEHWANQHAREPRPFALAMVDIDHFKRFNDDYGHASGDVVLKAVASAFSEHVRSDDAVVRYGGEEFAVVLPGAPLEAADAIMQRMRHAVGTCRCVSPDGVQLPPVTFSAGLVSVPTFEPQALLHKADQLLYEAKHAGRNCIRSTGVL